MARHWIYSIKTNGYGRKRRETGAVEFYKQKGF